MIPAYRMIINDVSEKINSGFYKQGEKLPSESQFSEEFSTSRITVTRALSELELKGVIYKVKGKGSFVSENTIIRNKIISLIIPHKADFFSGGQQYIRCVYKYCKKAGYLCSVHYSEQSSTREREILEELMNHSIAGVILYPINSSNIDSISQLLIKGCPIVLLDRKLEEIDIPVVESNNLTGAYSAVQYMISMGHQKIAFIGELDSYSAKERYKGYCRALYDNKIVIDKKIVFSNYSREYQQDKQHILNKENALKIVDAIEHNFENITALFCINDYVAFIITEALQEKGIMIPENISICGFDNLHYFPQKSFHLATVEQDFSTIGKTSVELLIKLINGEKDILMDNIIDTQLIKGQTVKKV
ncbi:MAG: GntR family transcriptional regulator [Spirochaetaceae bacterium]|jgi:GntR family transcriptional regulator of arabinose operon|nr:GntR family transcriptional regulator [Spirochaetaceae bacterium]